MNTETRGPNTIQQRHHDRRSPGGLADFGRQVRYLVGELLLWWGYRLIVPDFSKRSHLTFAQFLQERVRDFKPSPPPKYAPPQYNPRAELQVDAGALMEDDILRETTDALDLSDARIVAIHRLCDDELNNRTYHPHWGIKEWLEHIRMLTTAQNTRP